MHRGLTNSHSYIHISTIYIYAAYYKESMYEETQSDTSDGVHQDP